jgi:hypothetical protein
VRSVAGMQNSQRTQKTPETQKTQHTTRRATAEPESMDQLRCDCARMAPHWSSPNSPSATLSSPLTGRPLSRAPHEALHGVRVPAASARLLESMSEYGVW